jgi:Divergent InlB B-repeat domain/The GLUG motif
VLVLYELFLSYENLGKPLNCDEGGDVIRIEMLEKLSYYMTRLSILLIAVALIAGMVGCGPTRYNLTMAVAPVGGGAATDLTNASPYAAGTEVSIEAAANSGYWFVSWTAPAGTFANADTPETTFIMPTQDVTIIANFEPAEFHGGTGTAEDPYQIADWHQLDYVRNYLDGSFILVGNLDRTTPGYEGLASATAHQGAGWQPIGAEHDWFVGNFDGQGYELRDLFIDRAGEDLVGLFGYVDEKGVIANMGAVNATVTGNMGVGSLVGDSVGNVTDCYATGTVIGAQLVGGLLGANGGHVDDSHFTGSVTGTGTEEPYGSTVGGLVGYNSGGGTVNGSCSTGSVTGYGKVVGGLVGANAGGTVTESYSTSSVSGQDMVGGLVGVNAGTTVSDSYATGSVTGASYVGGLVGTNGYRGIVSNSYATGSVTGDRFLGGLVGWTATSGIVINSYYNYDEVLIKGENMITTGALFAEDFDEWLANGEFLDVNERLSQEEGYYLINSVSDFRELLAFGQDDSLKFRLTSDLDLAAEVNFFIPYLAGEFDGNGHEISNLSLNLDLVGSLGLFGYLAPGGNVTQVGVDNISVTGYSSVGGLVGRVSESTVSHSYSTGSVTGNENVGGLVGYSHGTVGNSYSTGSVTSYGSFAGGLAGYNYGTVSNCYATGTVTGDSSVGGLVGQDYIGTVSNCYATGTVTGNSWAGGLVGQDYIGTVSNSFWDTETSGQATSAGGTGKTTAQMKSITTFSNAGWGVIGVASPSTRNPAYTWNIVGGTTYPFLSWE